MKDSPLVPALSLVLLLVGVLAASWSAQAAQVREADRFVVVNGVRLHYVDWGGKGNGSLFLTPLGGDLMEQFASLAPQFTDRFRVLGLTRRGQGQSDYRPGLPQKPGWGRRQIPRWRRSCVVRQYDTRSTAVSRPPR